MSWLFTTSSMTRAESSARRARLLSLLVIRATVANHLVA
jgi:hypothetical protein